jgi:predicted transcriptional regulator
MGIEEVVINGKCYKYHTPTNYRETKLYLKQLKQIKEKIRATQSGCYANKITRKGMPYYQDYPELLSFLEKL